MKAGSIIDDELLSHISKGLWWQLAIDDEKCALEIEALNGQYELQKDVLENRFQDKVEKVRRGDDLPPGVMKMVKVFIVLLSFINGGMYHFVLNLYSMSCISRDI